MLLALENGYQAALMAPTELLAEQHCAHLQRSCWRRWVSSRCCVTGSHGRQGAPRRRGATRRAREPVLVVGTHALVQEGDAVRAARPRRSSTSSTASAWSSARRSAKRATPPDVLLMTATPIPRSLALTLYGDLDVSVLDERPPGRQPVTTALRPEAARDRVMEFVETQLAAGRQAYIVYPLIEESEKIELKAATTAFEALAAGSFAHRRVALLHGRLPAEEKDAIMRAFRDGEIDMLVATTVIEVGIDVPNATVMVIEHPERFGLSQLHQLRGRVGRGAEESFCILLGDVGPESARAAAACSIEHRGRLRDRARRPAAARHGGPVRQAAERAAGVQDCGSRARRGTERAGARRGRTSAGRRSGAASAREPCAAADADGEVRDGRWSSSGWDN